MIETDTWCPDVVTQVASATRALQEVAVGLLNDHITLVTVTTGGARHQILFDAGLIQDALVTNMRRLGIDPGSIEAVVLSR